jgi:Iap family predicted aminopeptidase
VVVVDEVVEVLEVVEVELVDVERCVVVVLRCVVVVRGAWVVVVGAGAAVVVVVGAGVSVVVVVGGGGSSAPAGPTPIPNTAIMSSSTVPPRAATVARRGVDGRITPLTLDRRCLLTWSVIRHVGRLALMLRTGIGGATTDGAA